MDKDFDKLFNALRRLEDCMFLNGIYYVSRPISIRFKPTYLS